jgi:uncharacterized protein
MDALGIGVAAAVMLVGLFGTVVPLWPGLLVIWVTGLVYGLSAGFGTVGLAAFGVMTALAIAGTVAKVVLPHRGGRAGGASGTSLAAGLAGAVVGAFVLPVVGIPVGAVAGVYLAERVRVSDPSEAWPATVGVLKGFGLGALVEFSLGVVMIATWAGWVLVGA